MLYSVMSNNFLSARVAIMKTKLCLLLFNFTRPSFVNVIFELLGSKKPQPFVTHFHSNDCKFRKDGFQ